MKRTNLVLDEQLLKEVTRTLGAKTYSAAVNQALEETLRLHKIRDIGELFGSGVWEGNLSEMRNDLAPSQQRSRTSRKTSRK